jgi:hypothetical protein
VRGPKIRLRGLREIATNRPRVFLFEQTPLGCPNAKGYSRSHASNSSTVQGGGKRRGALNIHDLSFGGSPHSQLPVRQL